MRKQVIEPLNGYTQQVGVWLWAFENSRLRTLHALEGISPDLRDWVPTWRGNTIGTLLYHLAAIEVDWLFTDIHEEKEFTPEIEALFPYDVRQPDGKLVEVKGQALDSHLQRLKNVRQYFLKSLIGMSDEEFQRVRVFPEYTVTPRWTIHHLMQHEAEHRGEIMGIREAYRYQYPDG